MRNQKTHEKKRTAPKKPVEQALEGKERQRNIQKNKSNKIHEFINIPKAQQTLKKMNSKLLTLRHILIKLLKSKTKIESCKQEISDS